MAVPAEFSGPAVAFAALIFLLPVVLWSRPGAVLIVFLVYLWLVAGRSDPGDLLAEYPIVRWGSYLLIPALTLPALARAVRRGGWRRTPIDVFIIAMVGVILLSGYVHGSSASAIVSSIAIYLRYPLLFVLLVNLDVDERAYRRALFMVPGIGVTLCIEAIVNYLLLGKQHDGTFFTVGTTWGTQTAGIFFLYGLNVAVADALRSRLRSVHVIALLLVLVAAWIASVRSVLMLLPPLGVLMYGVHRGVFARARLVAVAVGLLVVLIGAAFAPWRVPQDRQGILYKLYPGFRFDVDKLVVRTLIASDELALGAGPRSFSPGSIGPPGHIYQLVENHYHKTLRLPDVPPPNQIATSLSEIGVVGFTVYWVMLLAILRMGAQCWHQCTQGALAKGWATVSLAFIGVWFYYALFGLSYTDLWRVDASSFLFWTAAAAIHGELRRRAAAVG